MSVRVRFAPSPTGNLHIGGVRTALFNWLYARSTGGTFLLRIEDTDEARSTPEYEAVVLRELRWVGLDWDEGPEVGGPFGPYRQSDRSALYRQASEGLVEGGHAYRCTCTTERIEALREDRKGQRQGYDGHCRDLKLGPDCGRHVVRLRVREGHTHVNDLFKGSVTYDNAEIDDLILVRSDGVPTYNFVVVVDDVAMRITHVLRGEEHLNNTPKQILIYEALGAPMPRFGHMPLILGPDGSKLSKRHGATSVASYREMGILPEALLNYLARLGWSHGNMELFSLDEIRAVFTLDDIGTSPGKWDSEKLLWVNAHWMKTLPPGLIAERVRPWFVERGGDPGDQDLVPVVLALRERSRTLKEMAEGGAFLFLPDAEVERDPDAVRAFLTPTTLPQLASLTVHLEGLADWSEASLEAHLAAWCETHTIKLGKIAQPIRVAVSGKKVGPGLFQTLAILGRERTLRRLRSALDASAPPG